MELIGVRVFFEQVGEEGVDLVSTDVSELLEGPGGEELDSYEVADVAPVGPIVGRCDSDVVVGDVLGGVELGSEGEVDVILLEALLGEGEGGDNEDGAGPEAEEVDRPVAFGEAGQAFVEGFTEKVEVADDGEGEWAGREGLGGGGGGGKEEEFNDDEEGGDREGKVEEGGFHG